MMSTKEPCFCAAYNFSLGKKLVGLLNSVYGKAQHTYKGLLRSYDRPCVLFIPAPEPLDERYVRLVDYRTEETPFPIDKQIVAYVNQSVVVACPHSVTIAALNIRTSETDFDGLLREVEGLFCGTQTMSMLPPQHRPGGVDKFGYD